MEKIYAIIELLKVLACLLVDSDGDGRADLFDDAPEDPEVK